MSAWLRVAGEDWRDLPSYILTIVVFAGMPTFLNPSRGPVRLVALRFIRCPSWPASAARAAAQKGPRTDAGRDDEIPPRASPARGTQLAGLRTRRELRVDPKMAGEEAAMMKSARPVPFLPNLARTSSSTSRLTFDLPRHHACPVSLPRRSSGRACPRSCFEFEFEW